jgi:hypothetical protein
MILAHFHMGPMDSEFLILPTPEPWPKFVVPKLGNIVIPYFYLLGGQEDENTWSYLYDEDFSGLF